MRTWAIAVCAVLALLAGAVTQAGTVSIRVEEPSGVDRQSWPITSGVPFSRGNLRSSESVALFTDAGREVPLQTEALALWPDGSVRWLLLDFQTDLAANESRGFELRFGDGVTRSLVSEPVSVEREGEAVLVRTGPLEMRLDRNRPSLLGGIGFDVNRDGRIAEDERMLRASDSGISLAAPREYRLGPSESVVVESAGPMRASVRLEGKHISGDDALFRYVIRLHVYRGKSCVRGVYTFVNDHQESLMASLNHLELYVTDLAEEAAIGGYGYLLQTDEQHYEQLGSAGGKQASGYLATGTAEAGYVVALREFWQNWPKSTQIGNGLLKIGICPQLPAELYANKPLEEENKLYYHVRDGRHTFKVGVAKTHEFWFDFFAGPTEIPVLDRFCQAIQQPLLATCSPDDVCASGAAGELEPADPAKYFGYDAWMDRALQAHLARRDTVREYGMLNYGDWYGERSVNWGNLEYDFAHGLFLQYLRSGDRRYFARAEQAARHHIDVDVIHAINPHLENPWGPAPQVGEIWLHCLNHTGGYYEDAPLPVDRTYQMGHSTNFGHVWVSGDLDYYHLTGDRRALEVSLRMADAMARHMPTQYGTHIRALGWPMIMVLHAYEATADTKYLDAATANWEVLKKEVDWEKGWVVRLAQDHCLHGDRSCYGNVPFMEGLTLCALSRYHRVTQDPEVLKAITVGIDQMIRECWQEDVKTFRYTACPLSAKTPYSLFMLSVEAMAYEARLTGNAEHLRILREGFEAAVPNDAGYEFGKGAAQMIHFAPHGMGMLGQ